MTPMDRELLDRWTRSKDAKAFDSLVTAYSGLVYSACRRVLQDERAAEDIRRTSFNPTNDETLSVFIAGLVDVPSAGAPQAEPELATTA